MVDDDDELDRHPWYCRRCERKIIDAVSYFIINFIFSLEVTMVTLSMPLFPTIGTPQASGLCLLMYCVCRIVACVC